MGSNEISGTLTWRFSSHSSLTGFGLDGRCCRCRCGGGGVILEGIGKKSVTTEDDTSCFVVRLLLLR